MGQNQNRILKNTIYLYIRSIATLLIRLYSSRIILSGLGIEEFGVYQVIGGLIIMFSFLNSTMASATQRYISYEIGLGDKGNVKKIFSTAINIHIIIAIIAFILVETIGISLLHTTIKLGNVSLLTAEWVLHFTTFSMLLTITSVPYNSLLIAKENMSYFAYIDIIGEILKLIAALSLPLIHNNKLIFYSFFIFIISLIIRIIYTTVCSYKYKESRYHFIWDKVLTSKMLSFTGWTTLSSISYLMKNQGISIILNHFLGPSINAGMGIGNQVNSAIKTFSQNFQMSFMPQIVKTYANKEYARMNRLIFSGAKLSTYLLIAFSIPFMIECDYILKLWLNEIPPHSATIVNLYLFESIILTMTCTGNTAIRATGKIRNFEILYNIIDLLAIPFMLMSLCVSPIFYIPFVFIIIFTIFASLIKLKFLLKYIPNFDHKTYLTEIFIKIPFITLIAAIIPIYIRLALHENIIRVIITSITFELIFILIVYHIGLNKEEHNSLFNTIKKKIHFS